MPYYVNMIWNRGEWNILLTPKNILQLVYVTKKENNQPFYK